MQRVHSDLKLQLPQFLHTQSLLQPRLTHFGGLFPSAKNFAFIVWEREVIYFNFDQVYYKIKNRHCKGVLCQFTNRLVRLMQGTK